MKKILVIEDNTAEAIYAQAELARAGFTDFQAVTTLSEGLEAMPGYEALLTDLFFHAGCLPTEPYTQRFLPIYHAYGERRFKTKGRDVVLRAVKQCAETFGVTPHEYVEDFMAKVGGHLSTPSNVLKAARASLTGVEEPERYTKFLEIEAGVRNGTYLPLGVIATERARELGIPSVIVTSTYHHDDAFEAVRDLVKVPYRDSLVDGRKDWKGGITLLSR